MAVASRRTSRSTTLWLGGLNKQRSLSETRGSWDSTAVDPADALAVIDALPRPR